jgi:hypothetical protein
MRTLGGLTAIVAAMTTVTLAASAAPVTAEVVSGGGAAGAARTSALPAAGNPAGHAYVPPAGRAVSTAGGRVIGRGTSASCTSQAVVRAVAKGGLISFNCGSKPVTITMTSTAKVVNTSQQVVLNGGGKVTLSGGGKHRILYQDTCDKSLTWTTSHCDDQATPRIVLRGLTLTRGSSTAHPGEGGGAVFVRGGRLRVEDTTFTRNRCDRSGPDVGGAALRVFDQYDDQPVYVVNTTFGGKEGYGGVGSNGGGISSIGVSWTLINSLFSHNKAIGNGANPAQPGTPGGGSGGAIYNDGNTMTLSLCGTRIEHNEVNAHGSAIFFVTNDHSGDIRIDRSVIQNNKGGSWYATYPQISNHSDTPIRVTNSTIE